MIIVVQLGVISPVLAEPLDIGILRQSPSWYSSSQKEKLKMILAADLGFAQLVPLLPENFHIKTTVEDAPFQSLIDEAFLLLIKAPSMQKLCHNILLADAHLISSVLGVSFSTAKKISDNCVSFPGAQELLPNKRFYDKKYIFIFSPDTDLALDSWTNQIGYTYIFINPKGITIDRFLGILLHELAISLDFKEQIGLFTSGNGNFPELPEFESNSSACLVSFLRDPLIKYSFSGARAARFENEVLRQIGFKTNYSETFSCAQEFTNQLLYVASILKALSPEREFNHKLSIASCAKEHSPNLLEKIQALMNSKMIFQNKTSLDTCAYLTTPQLSLWTFSATEGGPRPRIGNGWGAGYSKPKEIRYINPELLSDKGNNFEKIVLQPMAIENKKHALENYLRQPIKR